MISPRISIVVPVRNGAASLADCLRSLLDQTTPRSDYEVIVVDDGSTDDTAEIAGQFPVKLLRQPPRGPAAARNHGAREALGEIFVVVDADCVAAKDWLARMVAPLDEDPGIAATMGRYRTRQTSVLARFVQMDFEDRYRHWKNGETIDTVFTHAAAFRRALFLEAGGFDETFPEANNEDTDFTYRLATRGHRMTFASDAVVYHRHPERLKRYFRVKVGRGYWRTLVYKRYPAKGVKDSYTPQMLKIEILVIYLVVASSPLLLLGLPAIPVAFLTLHGLLTLPFAWRSRSLGTDVALASPFYLIVRNIAFAVGITRALPRLWAFR